MKMTSEKQKILIITSEKDPASLNIKKHLLEYDFKETTEFYENNKVFILENDCFVLYLYTIKNESVFFEEVNSLESDFFIFPSKHSSSQSVPSLTLHVTGNWKTAEHGGKDKELSVSWVPFLKEGFIELNRYNKILNLNENKIQITMEVTHHGPLVKKPHAYIEIGSSEKEWKNPEYGKIIADTIITTLNKILSKDYIFKYKVAVGIGGPHYCNNMIKVQLSEEYALSHICPKHYVDYIDHSLIKKAIENSYPKADLVILDWKGIKNKEKLISLLEKENIEYIKTKDIKLSE